MNTTSEKITPAHLGRKAVVYVRQSTMHQVLENRESQRRQYELADRARAIGFQCVEVIDDDLGKSGSGLVERPGFTRLVAAVLSGVVGAVLCIEASRLARNGREWHHLVDLCALLGTLVIDADGVYDPRSVNDRLVLGLKGSMSEFELALFRQRSFEAIRAKAKRGELQFGLPIGLLWTAQGHIELDPDRRIQESIGLVFRKLRELGSVRRVMGWFVDEEIALPSLEGGSAGRRVEWRVPVYNRILAIARSPQYAGAYAFGRRESRTRVVEGRAMKTGGHWKPRDQWIVLIRDHHPGYISWEEFEHNQRHLAENAHMVTTNDRKEGRGGHCLLTGLLRCARCGRMLHVVYGRRASGRTVNNQYVCRQSLRSSGGPRCFSFGALRPDQAVGAELIRVLEPLAVEAAALAAERVEEGTSERRKIVELELEQARYEAGLAARRYEAIDPANRLVAAELEQRWNVALERVRCVESRLEETTRPASGSQSVDQTTLLRLASDLQSTWDTPGTDLKTRQRIVHLLIHEIIVNQDGNGPGLLLTIHWRGGRHSELRLARNAAGRHRHCTSEEAIEIVRRMAANCSDASIASTLNRLGIKTGKQNSWTVSRVASLRDYHSLPGQPSKARPSDSTTANNAPQRDSLTLNEAAAKLGVGFWIVRKLVQQKILPASQVVPCAPWQIDPAALESEPVRAALERLRAQGTLLPRRDSATLSNNNPTLPGI